MRLYYVGGEHGYTDTRLPGVLLDYGNAVDVHSDDLAEELLALGHFSDRVIPAQPVVTSPHNIVAVAKMDLIGAEDIEPDADDVENGDDLEVEDDNTVR